MLSAMDIDDDPLTARRRRDESGARARELRAQLAGMPADHPDREKLETDLREFERDVHAAIVTLTAHAQLSVTGLQLCSDARVSPPRTEGV